MKPHPYALIMPGIDGTEESELLGSMRACGFDPSFPIVRYQGQILDGRHRYEAATRLGIAPVFRDFEGDDDAALAFVLAANVARRHLTASQRAAIAAEIANMQRGRPSKTGNVAGFSQADAATRLNVSERSVRDAAAVKAADPDLHERVKAGEVTVSAAARQARGEPEKKAPPRPRELAALTEAKARVAELEARVAELEARRQSPLPSNLSDRLAGMAANKNYSSIHRLVSLVRHEELWRNPKAARKVIAKEIVAMVELAEKEAAE